MSTHSRMLALAVAVALGTQAAAGAQDFSFTYLEGGFIGGAWQFGENMHLFGDYSATSQDLEVSDGIGGEVAGEGSDAFDSDTLFALNGRWYFRPDIALVTGYELGKITFWKVGVRFTF